MSRCAAPPPFLRAPNTSPTPKVQRALAPLIGHDSSAGSFDKLAHPREVDAARRVVGRLKPNVEQDPFTEHDDDI
jgi:hypothetical protein